MLCTRLCGTIYTQLYTTLMKALKAMIAADIKTRKFHFIILKTMRERAFTPG